VKTGSNRARKAARTGGDRALWQEAVRDVEPLRDRKLRFAREGAPASNPSPNRVENSRASPARTPAPLDSFAGIDRANAERLKRGLHKVEATLDLHGMTQAEAHRALTAFVRISHQSGLRCLLVITGRGLGPSGPGILKRSLPRWLEEPELRRLILAIAPAQPRHGGGGAAYLLLRRAR
jgi:DNA-nicking Smr family endonuclease